jgi:4-hydroxy-3-methylbut-2-en-1-yl diphosphate reductase
VTLLVLVPMRVEELALGTRPGWRVLRTGMGPERARIAAARALAIDADAVVVAGVCGSAAAGLEPGDVVVATELRRDGVEPVQADAGAVDALEEHGLRTHAGPILSTDRITSPAERRALAADGVLAVDMESAWLAAGAGDRPFTVVRVVVETADRRLADPRTPAAGIRALRNLRRAGDALSKVAP